MGVPRTSRFRVDDSLRRWLMASCAATLLVATHEGLGASDPSTDGTGVSVQLQARPTYATGVSLVALDVCVKNRDGGFVKTLRPADFLVLEDRVPQTLEFFAADGRLPLSVVLLLDTSTSMAGPKLLRAKHAATAFLDRLADADLVEIMAFNQLADRRLPLSTDHPAAAAAIADLQAGGQTGLWEALVVALRDLQRAARRDTGERRQVILVLSDGEDTSSRLTFDDVLDEIRRSGTLVYGISLRTGSGDRSLPPPAALARLAHDTGGRAVVVHDLETLAPVYEEIAVELGNLYRLGYVPVPPTTDGEWRRIAVQLTDRSLQVRTRTGYYAGTR